MYNIVRKPIEEPVIDCTGAVNYSAANNIDPLVSLDMVREMYDMQAKSLRTILDEIYNSIAGINSGIETFQSDIDRTNNSYTLFQRTVNAQIDNIKHTIENAQSQTTLQLTSFSDRIDYIEKECNSMRNALLDHKQSVDDVIDTLNRNVTACRREVDKVLVQFEDLNSAIQDVVSANVSNEERINGILNHIIPNLGKEMEYHDGKIVKMIKAFEESVKNTDDKVFEQLNTNRSDIDAFQASLNSETIRAQNAELKLQELIQGNSTQAGDINRQIVERLDSHDTGIEQLDDRLSREIGRATGIEETLRSQLMSENTRAITEETNIKSDLKSISDLLNGKLDETSGGLSSSLATEISERTSADEAIRAEYDDQLGKIHEKIEGIVIDLTASIKDAADQERNERINEDVELGAKLDLIDKTLDGRLDDLSASLEDEIEKSSTAITNLNERLTRAHGDQLQTNGQNNVKFSEILKEIRVLSHRLDKFMDASATSTSLIDEKIKRATATIITRIENLDNRVDSEIDRARKAERHLRRRIDLMEGVPVDDESSSSDPCDKTDQGLMISDTEKEEN